MTEIRDCWRRDLSMLSPQQRRSAGYALRLLSLPRDPITGRLDANRLGMLWGMLQPLFEPRHLIDYLRPPRGVADLVHQDDDVVKVLDTGGLADDAVEMLDTCDLSDYAPPADAPLTTSDDQVMLALGHALLEEEIMAFEADHDAWVMATMPSVYIVQRLRWLIRRGDPLTLARLDAANPERVPASPTVALLGASLHLDGPTLSVLDFLDEFIATPAWASCCVMDSNDRLTPPPTPLINRSSRGRVTCVTARVSCRSHPPVPWDNPLRAYEIFRNRLGVEAPMSVFSPTFCSEGHEMRCYPTWQGVAGSRKAALRRVAPRLSGHFPGGGHRFP